MYLVQIKLNTMKKITFLKPLLLSLSLFCAVNFGFGQCGIGTATWDGTNWNWNNGTPQNTIPTIGTTSEVIINGLYITNLSSFQTSFSTCGLRVTSSGQLIVADNTFIEVQNDITVDSNGIFAVQSYGAVVQINDSATVINSGEMFVIKKSAPANAWYEYTYWNSPVSNETIGGGLEESNIYRRFSFTAQNFLDATAETGNNNATVAGQDDVDDNGDDWKGLSGAAPMLPGVGYAATHAPTVFAFSPGNQIDYVFEGEFNNGVISVPVYRNDASALDKNWNFIGNPYPSAISVASFFAQNIYNATTNPTGTLEGAIYYWSQNTPPSNALNGNETSNFSNSDYAMFNGTGGSAGDDLITPNAYTPSGQGFLYHSLKLDQLILAT